MRPRSPAVPRARHRPPARQGHQRPAGGREDRVRAGRPGASSSPTAACAASISRWCRAIRRRAALIDAPVGRDVRARTRMAVTHRGKEARTAYRVLRALSGAPRWSNAGSRPGARTRSACISSTSATRWSATRPTGAARATASPFRARRCTPPSSACVHPRSGETDDLVGAAAARHEAADRGAAPVIQSRLAGASARARARHDARLRRPRRRGSEAQAARAAAGATRCG